MVWIERILVVLVLLASAGAFGYILWTKRLRHAWPKRRELRVVNPGGLFSGAWEVLTQNVVLRNRPWVGLFHRRLSDTTHHVSSSFIGVLPPHPNVELRSRVRPRSAPQTHHTQGESHVGSG